MNYKSSKYKCYTCGQPLLIGTYRATERVLLWCGARGCNNLGANEGCVGDSEDKAFKVFSEKFGGEREKDKMVDMTNKSM